MVWDHGMWVRVPLSRRERPFYYFLTGHRSGSVEKYYNPSCGREVYVAGLGNQLLRKGSVAQGFDSPQLDTEWLAP